MKSYTNFDPRGYPAVDAVTGLAVNTTAARARCVCGT